MTGIRWWFIDQVTGADDCALCGGRPTHEVKTLKERFITDQWHRYVCDSFYCPGHHGSWHPVEGGAKRLWNQSQASKRSTIRRREAAIALQQRAVQK